MKNPLRMTIEGGGAIEIRNTPSPEVKGIRLFASSTHPHSISLELTLHRNEIIGLAAELLSAIRNPESPKKT